MRISAIAILVALFLWPAAVFGQSLKFIDAFNRVDKLYVEGRYQEAIPFAKEALRLSDREFSPDHPITGNTLSRLALLYKTQGRYAEVELLYKRSLAIYEKALGPDHPTFATGLNNLAEQRNADAQNLLGAMCDNGLGVLQHCKTTAKCYTLAAEQGDASAQ